jgi:hypothetical protein
MFGSADGVREQVNGKGKVNYPTLANDRLSPQQANNGLAGDPGKPSVGLLG